MPNDIALLRELREVVDERSRRRRSLWLFFVAGTGELLKVAVPIDDIPPRPDPLFVENLCAILRGVLTMESDAESAVLVLTGSDPGANEWAIALRVAASESDINLRLICLATPGSLDPLPLAA